MKPRRALLLATVVGLATSLAPDTAGAGDVEAPPSVCEVDVELVAIVYAPNKPASSFALVGARRGRIVRVGSWVEDRQILALTPRSLVLGPTEEPCLTRLTDRTGRGRGRRPRVRARRR